MTVCLRDCLTSWICGASVTFQPKRDDLCRYVYQCISSHSYCLMITVSAVSKIVEILLKIFKTHLILINFGILETILYLVQSYLSSDYLKHHQNILRNQITFPSSNQMYFYRSRWQNRYSSYYSIFQLCVALVKADSNSALVMELGREGSGLAYLQTEVKMCLSLSMGISFYLVRQENISLTSLSDIRFNL